jgi:hypothetical protein
VTKYKPLYSQCFQHLQQRHYYSFSFFLFSNNGAIKEKILCSHFPSFPIFYVPSDLSFNFFYFFINDLSFNLNEKASKIHIFVHFESLIGNLSDVRV